MDIGPVQVVVGRTMVLFMHLRERNGVQDFAGVIATEFIVTRPHRDFFQLRFQAEVVEHPYRVGALLDASADLAQLGCLLEHLYLESLAQQRCGGSQSTDTGTGDENFFLGHGGVSL